MVTAIHVGVFIFSAVAYLKVFIHVRQRRRENEQQKKTKKQATRTESKIKMLARVFGWISVTYGAIFVPLSLANLVVQMQIRKAVRAFSASNDGKLDICSFRQLKVIVG